MTEEMRNDQGHEPATPPADLEALGQMAVQMQEEGNRLFWGVPNKTQRQDMARLLRSGGFRLAEVCEEIKRLRASSVSPASGGVR